MNPCDVIRVAVHRTHFMSDEEFRFVAADTIKLEASRLGRKPRKIIKEQWVEYSPDSVMIAYFDVELEPERERIQRDIVTQAGDMVGRVPDRWLQEYTATTSFASPVPKEVTPAKPPEKKKDPLERPRRKFQLE